MLEQGIIDSTYQLGPWEEDIPDWSERDDSLQWDRRMAVYAAMVDRMDQGIGRVLETLRANDAWDNTLIFFLSDNGGSPEDITGRNLNDPSVEMGAQGSYVAYRKPWAVVSNTPFRRYKRWVEEGGIASPMIMHWPDRLPSGSEWVNDNAHVVDIFATVAEVSQASYPDSLRALRGQSLLPMVEHDSVDSERPLFWEHLGHQAMRQGGWKIISQAPAYQWSLFNIEQDPTELRDVSAQFPEVVQRMSADYEQWAQEVGVEKR